MQPDRLRPPSRAPALVLIGTVVGSLIVAGLFITNRAHTQDARDASPARPTADDETPRPQIVAHEWGVFRSRANATDYIEEIAREVPAFVGRPPQGSVPAFVDPNLMTADKPVIFLYGAAPDLRIDVTFTTGEPWLVFPSAVVTPRTARAPGEDRSPGPALVGPHLGPTLTWTGSIAPHPVAPATLQAATGWWPELRAVGAATFTTRAPSADAPPATFRASAERFIFYEGPMEVRGVLRLRGNSIVEVPANVTFHAVHEREALLSAIHHAYVFGAGSFAKWEYRAGRWSHARALDAEQARSALFDDLTAPNANGGLYSNEARALLRVWNHELFESNARAVVYLMPRTMYDRLLPIQFSLPTTLVRVGVVIQR